jgi:hypothetical protein
VDDGETAAGAVRSGADVLPAPDVIAVVALAAVPPPPPELTGVTDPIVRSVPGGGHEVVDWRLDPAAALVPGSVARFREWRERWSVRWSLGSSHTIRALEIAGGTADMPAAVREPVQVLFVAMRNASIRDRWIDPQHAAQAERVLADFEHAVARSPLLPNALAITALAGSATSRLYVGGPDPIAADAHLSVHVDPNSSMVVRRAVDGAELRHVATVDFARDLVQIVTADGRSGTLAQHEARPLGWLLPGALRWRTEPADPLDAWNPLFEQLPRALARARSAGVSVRFTVHG